MRVLVTGAAGFLGRAVVRAAHAAGHDVVAMVRPTALGADTGPSLPWSDLPIQVVGADLRQPGPWVDEIDGVDAVVHVAAATSGDLPAQFAGTVTATENLLRALSTRSLRRMVHVSSFSVYDYTAVPVGGLLDERTPLEPLPRRRDAYTTTKLWQERLVREACEQAEHPLVVVRPGMIYGPGSDWDHGAAFSSPHLAFVFSPAAPFRLVHVTNCADAMVLSLTAEVASGSTFNLVDDDLPTHMEYFRACRSAGLTRRRAVPVPWRIIESVGRSTDLLDRQIPGRHLKLPELLELRRQRARWKPLRYTNEHAKRSLEWVPKVQMADAVIAMEKESG